MKLWLHFNDVLQEHRDEFNAMEIADIQFSFCTSAKFQTIFRLQEFEIQIEDIQDSLQSDQITIKERSDFTKSLEKLKDKKSKYDVRLREIVSEEKKMNKATTKVANKDFVHQIDYAWVTFRNNLTPMKVLEKFEVVHPFTIILRKLLMIET
jgi:hypothetical protein